MDYSAILKNEILSFADIWIEVENIILSEVSQVQNFKGHIFLSYVDYRPITNISNLMKSRSCLGEVTYKRRRVKEGS
jgi:hypothetical protein